MSRMSRRPGSGIQWILFLTVPMLFAIGTVLSVLLFFEPDARAVLAPYFPLLYTVFGLTVAALCCAVTAAVLFLRFRNKTVRTDEVRDRFLSDVAHELKTPLTVIRGSAEVMVDGAVEPERFPEYCGRILNETDAMSRLVTDLLDVSRMKAGKTRLQLRDVDLAVLAASTVESLAPLAEKAGVQLSYRETDKLPVLLLDYDRVRQLAVIFIDNAIKHTPAGGSVEVTTGRNGANCFLAVKDTGDGIAPEDLPYLFDRFYKADPSRGGLASGSGIGLSVAQQIVRLHGGSVSVESQPGAGACFTAYLPVREFREET